MAWVYSRHPVTGCLGTHCSHMHAGQDFCVPIDPWNAPKGWTTTWRGLSLANDGTCMCNASLSDTGSCYDNTRFENAGTDETFPTSSSGVINYYIAPVDLPTGSLVPDPFCSKCSSSDYYLSSEVRVGNAMYGYCKAIASNVDYKEALAATASWEEAKCKQYDGSVGKLRHTKFDPHQTHDCGMHGCGFKFKYGYVPSDRQSHLLAAHTSHSFECAHFKKYLQVTQTSGHGDNAITLGGTTAVAEGGDPTNLQHITMLKQWATNDRAWSDRTYAITDLGEFTTCNYDLFMQTSVSQRTSTWSFTLLNAARVAVLTDAGSTTAPELSGWTTCSGTVQYHNTYSMSQCRQKDFGGGQTVSVTSPGAKNMVFIKHAAEPTVPAGSLTVTAIVASAPMFVACHQDEEATDHIACTKIKRLSTCDVFTLRVEGSSPEAQHAMARVKIEECERCGSTQGECSKQQCSELQAHQMMISKGLGTVEEEVLQPTTAGSIQVCPNDDYFLKPVSYVVGSKQTSGHCAKIVDDNLWLSAKAASDPGGMCTTSAGGEASSVSCGVKIPFQNTVISNSVVPGYGSLVVVYIEAYVTQMTAVRFVSCHSEESGKYQCARKMEIEECQQYTVRLVSPYGTSRSWYSSMIQVLAEQGPTGWQSLQPGPQCEAAKAAIPQVHPQGSAQQLQQCKNLYEPMASDYGFGDPPVVIAGGQGCTKVFADDCSPLALKMAVSLF